MKKFLLWMVILAVVAALIQMPRLVEDSIPSIYYVTPSAKTYENIISCAGTVQPQTVQEIYLSTAATAVDVLVGVGERVEAGQLLARLEPILPENAGLLALAPPRRQQNADLASVAALYGLSAALGGALTDYSELDGLLALFWEQQISEVQSSLVDESLEVRAEIAGVVTEIGLRKNAVALPGIPLMTISGDTGFKVLASVPEREVAKVNLGDQAEVRCTAVPSRLYLGEVVKIHPAARKVLRGTATETVIDIEIALTNADDSLKPGYTAKVDVLGGQDFRMITVPYEAIRQDENNDEYVFVYQNGAIKKTLIVTGKEMPNEVEVLHGLVMDSVVIYNPGDIVRECAIIHLRGRADVD